MIYRLNLAALITLLAFSFYATQCHRQAQQRQQLDLSILDLTVVPPQLIAGGTLNVSFRIRNSGPEKAAPFSVALHLSADATLDESDQVLKTVQVPDGLGSGVMKGFNEIVTVPTAVSTGEYTIWAEVDNGHQIYELDEDNNTLAIAQPISIRGSGADTDLVPSNVQLGSVAVLPGDSLNISYTLQNTGMDLASGSKTVVYFSEDEVIGPDDTPIGEAIVASLRGMTNRVEYVSVTIPTGVSVGEYTIGVVVDAEDSVEEISNGNNIAIASLSVEEGSIPGTDLVLTGLSVQPTSVHQGGSVTVYFTVKNRGQEATSSSFMNGIYLPRNQSINEGAIRVGVTNVPSLTPGETHVFNEQITLPSAITPGHYYIGVRADETDIITESNEANNDRIDSVGLTVLGPAQVDLTIPSVSVSEHQVTAGETVEVAFSIKNGEVDNSGTVNARIILSTDSTQPVGEQQLKEVTVPNLEPGQEKHFIEPVIIPFNIDNRSYFVMVVADPNNQLAETNENNNVNVDSTMVAVTGGGGCTDDQLEPNDAQTSPHVFTQPGTHSLLYCSGNDDWYAVDLTLGGTLQAAIRFSDSQVDLEMKLFDPDGDEIDSSNTSTDNEAVSLDFAAKAGRYTIHVYRYQYGSSSDFGPYEMDISFSGAGGDGIDLMARNIQVDPVNCQPGDSVAVTFSAYNLGTQSAGAIPFQVFLSADQVFDGSDLVLLSDQISSLSGGSSQEITRSWVTVPASTPAANYYLGVVIDPGNSISETHEDNNIGYLDRTMTVGGIDGCIDDSFEDNDDAASAVTMAPGLHNNLQICKYDEDFYSVMLGVNQTLKVNIYFNDTDGDLDLYLKSSSGGDLPSSRCDPCTSSSVTDDEYVSYRAGSAGAERILIQVKGWSSAINSYSMKIEGVGGIDLVPSGLTVAPLSLQAGDDLQLGFVIGNQIYDTAQPCTGEVRLSLDDQVDSADTLLGTFSIPALSGAQSINFLEKVTIPHGMATGVYHVGVLVDVGNAVDEVVETNNMVAKGGIAIFSPCSPDVMEPNDSQGSPRPVIAGTYPGLEICYNDEDWFEMDIRRGQNLDVNVLFSHADGDLDVILYKASTMRVVARGNSHTDNELLTLQSLDAGKYLLRIFGFNNSLNHYELRLSHPFP